MPSRGVCGTASIMAAGLPKAEVEDILLVNKVIQVLKNTADRTLKVWPVAIPDLRLFTFSEAGGVLGERSGEWIDGRVEERAQGAWLVFAGRTNGANQVSQMTPLIWKSGKLKRKVPSTLAGETLALGKAVASVEWLQVFLSDVLFDRIPRKDWAGSLSEFSAGVDSESRLAKNQAQSHVVDAKAVFDTLQKEAAGPRQDRRAAIDLSITQESVQRAGARVR